MSIENSSLSLACSSSASSLWELNFDAIKRDLIKAKEDAIINREAEATTRINTVVCSVLRLCFPGTEILGTTFLRHCGMSGPAMRSAFAAFPELSFPSEAIQFEAEKGCFTCLEAVLKNQACALSVLENPLPPRDPPRFDGEHQNTTFLVDTDQPVALAPSILTCVTNKQRTYKAYMAVNYNCESISGKSNERGYGIVAECERGKVKTQRFEFSHPTNPLSQVRLKSINKDKCFIAKGGVIHGLRIFPEIQCVAGFMLFLEKTKKAAFDREQALAILAISTKGAFFPPGIPTLINSYLYGSIPVIPIGENI